MWSFLVGNLLQIKLWIHMIPTPWHLVLSVFLPSNYLVQHQSHNWYQLHLLVYRTPLLTSWIATYHMYANNASHFRCRLSLSAFVRLSTSTFPWQLRFLPLKPMTKAYIAKWSKAECLHLVTHGFHPAMVRWCKAFGLLFGRPLHCEGIVMGHVLIVAEPSD